MEINQNYSDIQKTMQQLSYRNNYNEMKINTKLIDVKPKFEFNQSELVLSQDSVEKIYPIENILTKFSSDLQQPEIDNRIDIQNNQDRSINENLKKQNRICLNLFNSFNLNQNVQSRIRPEQITENSLKFNEQQNLIMQKNLNCQQDECSNIHSYSSHQIIKLNKKICCNCKKSSCLKLYCECFATGQLCQGCNCLNCANKSQNSTSRIKNVQQILELNQETLTQRNNNKSNIENNKQQQLTLMETLNPNNSKKGCNCKKSGCQKKYCECYQSGILCSKLCKCLGCKNCEEELLRKRQAENQIKICNFEYGFTDQNSEKFTNILTNGTFKKSKQNIIGYFNSFQQYNSSNHWNIQHLDNFEHYTNSRVLINVDLFQKNNEIQIKQAIEINKENIYSRINQKFSEKKQQKFKLLKKLNSNINFINYQQS